MKKCITVIGVLCLSISIIGCSSSYAVNFGTVELVGNPTTGFVWEYEIANPGIIEEVSNEFIAGGRGDDDIDIAGAGGIYNFTFKGVAQGETLVTFKYHRPWEEDVPPEETVTFIAVVDSRNVITLTKE
jgi:predicted secreted protein